MTVPAALEEVDELADAFVRQEPVPGVAYGIVLDGKVIHSRGIGTTRVGAGDPPGARTIFRIASMTKSFTAATVLLLRDEGLLRLDDRAADSVPELAGLAPAEGAPPITIRHLLTMSAGFAYDDAWGDRQQDLDLDRFAKLLAQGPSFAWMPGTQFEYSNLGYGILGRAITNVAGREYRDVVRERLLEPLGMSASGFGVDELPADRLAIGYTRRDDAFVEEPFAGYGALASMGGVFSTVGDLARWVEGFVRAFAPRERPDEHPLSPATRLEMQQVHRAAGPELRWTTIRELPTASVEGYGYGLFVRSDLELGLVVAHSGGYPGFGSHMRWHPASGLGVIVLGNRTYFPASKLGEQMMRALVLAGAAPSRRALNRIPALETARQKVERLLESWDDRLAAEIFSMNVDLDEPIERQRATIERLRETHGRLRRSDEPPTSDSPFDVAWWLEGERGRVRVEISLDPQPAPKVQSLDLTSVPEPGRHLREAAAAIVDSVEGGTPDVELDPGADRSDIERDLLLVRTLFGTCRLGPPVASSATGATFRVDAERGPLELRIAIDEQTGLLTSIRWVPRPVRPPIFDAR